MGRNFTLYSLASLALLLGTIVNAARIHHGQYFSTVVHLTNTPAFAIILTNAAVWLVVMLGKLTTKCFFGDLTLLERQKGVERFFMCMTESVFAMAYLQFVGYGALRLFVCSVFLRVFHSLARYRHETIENSAQQMAKQTIRLTILTLLLFIIDVACIYYFSVQVSTEGKMSMSLTFLLDSSLMALSAIGTLVKVYINACSRANSGSAADRYHATKFYVNVVLSVTASILHVAFFATLMLFTLPIHLIRDLFINLSEMAANCRHLLNYIRLTANIDRVLPDATAAQLEKDPKCAICYEDMVEGTHCKSLPCGHVFHRQCLLRWFEKQTACAYCGKDVKQLFQAGPRRAHPQQQPAAAAPPQQPAAAAVPQAAAAAVPAAQVQQQQQQRAFAAFGLNANAPVQQPPALTPIAADPHPLEHADLDALTDEELERELHRLAAEFQAAADRGVQLPALGPSTAETASAASVATPKTPSTATHAADVGRRPDALLAVPQNPLSAATIVGSPTNHPRTMATFASSPTVASSSTPATTALAQQVAAYKMYVAEQRAALDALERRLAAIGQFP